MSAIHRSWCAFRISTLNQRTFLSPVCHQRFFSTAQSEGSSCTFAQRYASRDPKTGAAILKVGDFTEATKTFTADDIKMFNKISGDDNPLHDPEDNSAAQQIGFDKSICHGMFSGALFGTAVGSTFPSAVLLEKSLRWRKPLYVDETLHAHVQVTKVLHGRKLVYCDLVATNQDGVVLIDGTLTLLIKDLSDKANESDNYWL